MSENKNDLRVEYDGKFYIAEKLTNEIQGVHFHHKNQGRKICVVYSAWSTHWYLNYMKHSIYSQFLNTDIAEKCDIKIFLDHNFYEWMKHLYKGILDENCFVHVHGAYPLKYTLSVHPELKDYDYICFCDSDLFFLKGSQNFYENLENKLSQNPQTLFMAPDRGPAELVFWQRHASLAKNIPAEKYVDYFTENCGLDPRILNFFLKTQPWALSCIMAYDNKTCFKEPDFYKLAMNSLFKFHLCDETIWMMYAVAKGYGITTVHKAGINWFTDPGMAEKCFDSPTVIHPIFGHQVLDDRNFYFLDNLEKEMQRVFPKKD